MDGLVLIVLDGWEKDKKIKIDDSNNLCEMREWEGTSNIAKWYRETKKRKEK